MRTRPLSAALAAFLALAGCSKPAGEHKLDRSGGQRDDQASPALTGKLAEQIIVDPAKAEKASAKAAPAPAAPPPPIAKPTPPAIVADARPRFAKVPPPIALAAAPAVPPPPAPPAPPPAGPTLGQLAQKQAVARPAPAAPAKPATAPANVGPVSGECYAKLAYAPGWAARLPAALPLYPGATLSEAAGNEEPGCAVRIVSFGARAPWRTIADWYAARAGKAGWDAGETMRGGAHVVAGTAADGSAFYITLTPRPDGGTSADMIVSLGR